MFEQKKSRVFEAERKLRDAVAAEYPRATRVRFEWVGKRPVLGEVVNHHRGAVQVHLLEDVAIGVERKGNRLWIDAAYIVEKL